MAVANTVQGLNNVIDLLKNILDTLKDDQKAVQPGDVSSTSRITAKSSSDLKISSTVNELNALGGLKKNISNKAGSFVNIISTITSKETLSGITKFALMSKTGIFKMFATGIDMMVDALNRLGNIKVSKSKLKTFTTVLETVKGSTKIFTDALYSLAGVIVVAAAIGVFAALAWPQILIGFGVLTATMAGVIVIVFLMNKLINFLYGSKVGVATGTNDMIADVKFGADVLIFQQVAKIFLYLAGIVVVAAAVGLLAQIAMPQILSGLALIGGLFIVVTGMILLFGKILNTILKGDVDAGVNFGIGIGAIAMTVMILYSLAFLVVLAAGVGVLAEKARPQIWKGFVIIGAIFVIITGLVFLIAWLSTFIQRELLGKTAGILALVGFTVFIFAFTTLTVTLLAATTKKINEAGGQKEVWKTVGMVGAIIGAMALLAVGLAALSLLVTPAGVWAAAGVIFAIGYTINSVGKVIETIVDVLFKIDEYKKNHENRDPFEGMGLIGLRIGWFLTTLVAGLAPAGVALLVIGSSIKDINRLMDTVSKFIDMVGKFVADGNKLKPIIGRNSDGTAIYGEAIDIVKISEVIGNSFVTFVDILSEQFKKMDNKTAKTIKKYGKSLNKIMDPVASFIDIVTEKYDKLEKADLNSKAKSIATTFTSFTAELAKGMAEADRNAQGSGWQRVGYWFKDIFSSGARRTKKWAETGSAALDMVANLSNVIDLLTQYDISEDGKTITYKDENGNPHTENLNFVGIASIITNLNNALSDISDDNISNLEKLGSSFEKFEEIIVKNQEKNIKAIKEYTKAIKEMTDEFKNAAGAIDKVNGLQLPETTSNKSFAAAQYQPTYNSGSTAVASTPQQTTQAIDGGDLAEAIKEGLNGAILKVSFSDSIEEFTAELAIS